ncbi:hypothetical protein [Stenotrophomonas sp. T8]|uniref:hypothetical protein n=1 Tax=Stenotrophomonas sp. T8 TaxID=3446365 RepID=UPI003F701364
MESLANLLANVPPGVSLDIEKWFINPIHSGLQAALPRIRLHCSSEHCGGDRFFRTTSTYNVLGRIDELNISRAYYHYVCCDCSSSSKVFALQIKRMIGDQGGITFQAMKFGEEPAFGPPIPAKAMTLVGPDRDAFLKGRRAESLGLGVGAFAYYRRVIENQKGRLFDEFIRVLRATLPNDPVIDDLERAKKETQFSKSLQSIKHAIPTSLLINGQNPISLLHTALSEGIHALEDEECLEYATAIRTILFETSNRLASAMSDNSELSKAITLLTRAGQNRQ